jgi:hypothetical protein
MSGIYGALGVNDTDRVFINTLGQRVVYDAISQLVTRYNADIAAQMRVFVEGAPTENFKERYKLPGGGRLQRLGTQSQPGAIKATGQWDVAYPLESFSGAIAAGRIDYAYMTTADLDRHLQTVTIQDTNTRRYEVLKALLNNTARTFSDPHNGSLSVQPLANGDSVLYPPKLGTESEATDDHYLVSGYSAASISDTNNPLKTIRDELEQHFGAPTGGSNLAVLISSAQTSKITDLTEFNRVNDRMIIPGANADQVTGMPQLPGRILGRTDSGVTVSEWRWLPSDYMIGIVLDAPPPLKMRVDPASTNLPRGLTLVVEDEEHPFRSSFWEDRFGFGVGNRLNGVVMQLKASGSYDIPSGY